MIVVMPHKNDIPTNAATFKHIHIEILSKLNTLKNTLNPHEDIKNVIS